MAGGRSVDDHQVVLAGLLDPAVGLGELPDLADRDQLLEARGGRGQVVEDPRAHQQVAHRPHLELEQQVLAQRLVRVDRDRPEVVRNLDLVEADLALLEHARGVLLASPPRRRSCACRGPPRRGPARWRSSTCRRLPCRSRRPGACRVVQAGLGFFQLPRCDGHARIQACMVVELIISGEGNRALACEIAANRWDSSTETTRSKRWQRAAACGPMTCLARSPTGTTGTTGRTPKRRMTALRRPREPQARPRGRLQGQAAGEAKERGPGQGDRLRQPEGRRRQDDHRAQPRRRLQGVGPPRARRRHGPAGQPDHEPGRRPRQGREEHVRRARAQDPDAARSSSSARSTSPSPRSTWPAPRSR